MKVLLEIREDKFDFMMELLESFPFVKTQPLNTEKAELIAGLKEAIQQINLSKEEKISLKPAREFLDEL